MKTPVITTIIALTVTAYATEFHVATTGKDTNTGAKDAPVRTIQRAADLAQPGDVVTVHEGVYRERVNPPRGGVADERRIIYQAAPGEKVVITGSEVVKGWEKVERDTWKATLPNKFFGNFNPYAEKVHGDWFNPQGREHHRGCVYLGDDWLTEAATLDQVLGKPSRAAAAPSKSAKKEYLVNLTWLRIGDTAEKIPFTGMVGNHELKKAPCSEGGECVGWIEPGDWIRCERVNFKQPTEQIELRASCASSGVSIEIRRDTATGELLGSYAMANSGGWQSWVSCKVRVKPLSGVQTLCFVFNHGGPPASTAPLWFAQVDVTNTTIWAQFPSVNPNTANVEINVRPTVFTPEKTNIDYITVRGFDLRNAASNWAAPTSGQHGLVTAYWCKGWIIENNVIHHSRCSGIALGKYSDQYDNTRGNKEGYDGTIADALKLGGWTKEKIGGHIVRNNRIHHCGQTGIVGSLGCAFSRIENNEIHDINLKTGWGGAEMAGIKFHGALDVVIKGNHIHNCGPVGGLWLDWMAQGTQVIGNLFHDNMGHDIFTEVNHGPFVIANNILLSPGAYLANSQGGAYAHNLILGSLRVMYDKRQTPYHKAHSTELAGRRDCPIGDVHWYNNLLAARCNLGVYNGAVLPVVASGNVFTKGAQPSKFDKEALVKTDFDPDIKLVRKADGWYLEIKTDPTWATEQSRKLVTAELLGKAVIPDLPFENPDGSPLKIDADYFGKPRNPANPAPGPFANPGTGAQTLKVW
jgi:hypothetical protein